MKYIQCFPLYNAKPLCRLIRYALRANAGILLDLEDSILDIYSRKRTYEYKSAARDTLLDLAPFIKDIPQIHIRINAVSSIYFEQDINCLKKLKDIVWESIFIPKFENQEDITKLITILDSNEIKYRSLSPIIETVAGYDFMINDYEATPSHRFGTAYFGNYDYNLSIANEQLIEQDNDLYWQTVLPLINKVEHHGLRYGNSPYTKLSDMDTLLRSMQILESTCLHVPTQICLSINQPRVANAFVEKSITAPNTQKINREGQGILASTYKPLSGRSFAFDTVSQKITTPHEFLMNDRYQKVGL